jgi:transaldolase/glucose-6-phosphate isomerase
MNAEHETLLQTIRMPCVTASVSPPSWALDHAFCTPPDRLIKAARTVACFCKSLATTRHDLAVPGQKYTFGIVKAAQARGDFQVLADRKRRALRVHLGSDVKSGLTKLVKIVKQIL